MARKDDISKDALNLAFILRERALSELCETSFREFVRQSWPILSPGVPYIHNWHIDCLCEHVEALARREILRLIINICPRSAKSTILSVQAAAWRWIKCPEEKFVSSSYGRSLAMRDARRTRSLIKSPWYQSRWGNNFRIVKDQDEKGRFENDKGGYRLANSVEGGVLGEGGSWIIMDDPNDLDKMEFADYRQSVKDWYSNSLASRYINPKTDVRLCVQQRSSYGDDLTSYLLELGGWEHLVIPNEYDGTSRTTSIGWRDPRTHIGELMHPERLGPAEVATLKVEMRDNYCTPGYTPILMSDFTEKHIQDIKIGDEVIGYARDGHQKMRLVRSTVKAVSCSVQRVVRMRMESGREVHCTPDHRWYRYYSGKGPDKYLPAKLKSRLHSVYVPVARISEEEQRLYDWLGGMIDGEGSCVGKNPVSVSQAASNPELQQALTDVLTRLGFRFKRTTIRRSKEERHGGRINPKWSEGGCWILNGGRSTKIHILAHCKLFKKQRIVDGLWATAGNLADHFHGSKPNHRIVSIEPLGEMPVYGLTTTTGNYVAWGFASQNSGQYNQQPSSISGGRLKREWLNFWNPSNTERIDESGKVVPVRLKRGGETIEKIPRALPEAFEQVVQSWDMAFKDEAVNSQVAGHAWGRIGANCYLIERDTQHRNFPSTLAAFRAMSARIPCPEKLVEEKANGPAVIQTLRDEIPGIVPVNPEGGKFARVAAISGYVEAGNVWLPNPEIFPWVWDFLTELEGSPQDDTDAMTQALTRLFASMANQGVPEFRVQPRVGEPQTACHITRSTESVPAEWRRFVAILPNEGALWLSETPTGSLRVLHELSLKGIDAAEAGRRIAKISLPDVLARVNGIHALNQTYELLLPKAAFAPVEPIGSYAELLEQGLLAFIPEEGDFEFREHSKTAIKEARFRTDMVEEEDAALDRLRSLLAFAPPDFEKVPYDRKKAFALAEADPYKYAEYIMAVEGEVRGEWPKLKISPKCPELISQLGAFRRDRLDEAPAMVRALLLGVCVPRRFEIREIKERPAVQRPGRGNLLSKKFSMGRR